MCSTELERRQAELDSIYAISSEWQGWEGEATAEYELCRDVEDLFGDWTVDRDVSDSIQDHLELLGVGKLKRNIISRTSVRSKIGPGQRDENGVLKSVLFGCDSGNTSAVHLPDGPTPQGLVTTTGSISGFVSLDGKTVAALADNHITKRDWQQLSFWDSQHSALVQFRSSDALRFIDIRQVFKRPKRNQKIQLFTWVLHDGSQTLVAKRYLKPTSTP